MTVSLYLFLTLAILGQAFSQRCLSGWEASNGQCFLFNNKTSTWQDSRAGCVRAGGDLLKLENQKDKAWLLYKLQEKEKKFWWTGLHREENNDCKTDFKWIDDTKPDFVNLVRWNKEPNNWDGNEHCGEILKNGVYNDQNCAQKRGYICKDDIPMGELNCPYGWFTRNLNCYYISARVPTEMVDWESAKTKCKSLFNVTSNCNLLTVSTSKERDFITEMVSHYWNVRSHSFGWWTGLNDLPDGSSGWKWLDSTTPAGSDTMIWNQEPNSYGLNNEHCAAIYYDSSYHDQNCDIKHRYICSRYITPTENCPPGWFATRPQSGSPINCLYISPEADKKSWDDAASHCLESYSANLLMVADAATKMLVDTQVASNGLYMYWTGLNDRNQEERCQKWHWADHSPVKTWAFIQWNREPNNMDGNEHCGEIKKNGVYNDNNCDTRRGSLCKYKLQPNDIYCPSILWMPWNGYCYQWSPRDQGQMFTWLEARENCMVQHPDADLLSIESQEERDFIRDMTGSFTLRRKRPVGWWTGLTDLPSGTWTWNKKRPANLDFVDWEQEPNSYGSEEYCAAIYYDSTFHDHGCDIRMGSICQKKDNVNGVTTVTGSIFTIATIILTINIV